MEKNIFSSKRRVVNFAVMILFLSLCAAVPAQVYAYTISGTALYDGAPHNWISVSITGGPFNNVIVATDSSGKYIIPNVPDGTYQIAARMFDPSRQGASHIFKPDYPIVTVSGGDLVVNFTSVTFSVSGQISYQGIGLSGYNLKIDPSGWATPPVVKNAVTTDSSGYYVLSGLGSGTYIISRWRDGYFGDLVDVTINNANLIQNKTAQFIGFNLTGTVTYNGVGQAGVKIDSSTITDASGNYKKKVYAGNNSIRPSLTGFRYSPQSANFYITPTSKNIANVNFTASPVYVVKGKVTAGSAGVSGVYMELCPAGSNTPVTTHTDANGDYVFNDVPNGTYNLRASKTYYNFAPAPRTITVSGAMVSGINFAATYFIKGWVTLGANYLADVGLNLSGTAAQHTTSGTGGLFAFSGLPYGSYTVTPVKAGYTFDPQSKAVSISGSDSLGNSFRATYTGFNISGNVSGVGAGATVTLSGTQSKTATTDANGNYSFTGLGNGNYIITVRKTGYGTNPASRSAIISNGDLPGINFNGYLMTYSISGTLYDNAVAMPNAMVFAKISTTGADAAKAYSGATGAYTLSGLPNGSYTITPFKPGYAFKPINWSVSVSDAIVAAKNFTGYPIQNSISGRVTAKGSGLKGVTVMLTSSTVSGRVTAKESGLKGATVMPTGSTLKFLRTAVTDELGNYVFDNIVNGTYTVKPNATGIVFTPVSKTVSMIGAGLSNINFAY